MPAYNHERFVGAAIESVLQQTCHDIELIIIDDGSKDRTGEIARSYQDPRVAYTCQQNQDAYNALNRGLKTARGEFVAILNSDDLYAPNRLEVLLAAQRDTGAACLFTDVTPIDAQGHELTDPNFYWHVWHRANREHYFRAADLYTGFLHGNFMVTTSNLFLTRAAVEQVGGFAPLRYLHDYDYMFRLLRAYPAAVRYLHDQKLLYYRIHGSNTLGEGAIRAREEDQRVIRQYLLAAVPSDLQALVGTGADRLAQLARELAEERARPPARRDAKAAARAKAWLARGRGWFG